MSKRETIDWCDDQVGERLRQVRIDGKFSQRDLAFPGCTAAYISRIEKGERRPSLQILRQLAIKLGVSENYLAWGEEQTPRQARVQQLLVEASDDELTLIEALLASLHSPQVDLEELGDIKQVLEVLQIKRDQLLQRQVRQQARGVLIKRFLRDNDVKALFSGLAAFKDLKDG